MLVRSSSTPSWLPSHSHEPSPEFFSKPHSISITSHFESSTKKIPRVRSQTDVRGHKRGSSFSKNLNGLVADKEEEEEVVSLGYSARDRLFSSSGLDEVVEEDGVGGGIGIGRNNGSGRFNGDGSGDGEGDTRTDAYYRKMIEQDPGNGLILGNYAKFLKEVRKEVVKAEEYCERAILTNPNDGKVVALYAELIWEIHRDTSRAEKYFDQAVQLEPNDCYVTASYARFLWDTEEEEEEEEDETEEENGAFERCKKVLTRPSDLYQGFTFPTISSY